MLCGLRGLGGGLDRGVGVITAVTCAIAVHELAALHNRRPIAAPWGDKARTVDAETLRCVTLLQQYKHSLEHRVI